MTRVSPPHYRELVRRDLARRGVKVEPSRRRGVPSKWEASFRDEWWNEESVGWGPCRDCLNIVWRHEGVTLDVGLGAAGLRAARYTGDWLIPKRDCCSAGAWLIEVKGRRGGEHRSGMVAFKAAAAQWGWLFRFGLAEGGPGQWRCTWLN